MAERGSTLIDTVPRASDFHMKVLRVGVDLPANASLPADRCYYACDVFKRSATTANPDQKSAYETWHGKPPPPTSLRWLKPWFYRIRRTRVRRKQIRRFS